MHAAVCRLGDASLPRAPGSAPRARMMPPAGRLRMAAPQYAQAIPSPGEQRSTQPLTSDYLRSFLDAHGIKAELVAGLDLSGRQDEVIKSLVFMAYTQPVLVVVRGADRVEARKVADTLGIARRRVRLASPREALLASGFAVGTVPPFGHPEPLRTLLDSAVLRQPLVFGGGGHPDVEVAVRLPDLLHFAKVRPARHPPPAIQGTLNPDPTLSSHHLFISASRPRWWTWRPESPPPRSRGRPFKRRPQVRALHRPCRCLGRPAARWSE